MKRWISANEDETRAIGREIAAMLPDDALIYLSGDLGAGKTTLVRAIAEEVGCDPGEVASPSFALVHEYPRKGRASVVHVDGYRLSEHPHEWMEIGIDELLRAPGIKFVEWPKHQFDELADAWGVIRVRVEDDERRVIELE